MRTIALSVLTLFLLAGVSNVPAAGATTIYRCEGERGIVLSDKKCGEDAEVVSKGVDNTYQGGTTGRPAPVAETGDDLNREEQQQQAKRMLFRKYQ